MLLPKILHISTAKTWRGGEQQIAYLHKELNAMGLKQHVLCAKNSAIENYFLEKDLSHTALRKKNSFSLAWAKAIRKIVRAMDIDCIHAHDSHAHNMVFLSSLVLRNSTPYVVSRRVEFRIKGLLSKIKYNQPDLRKILCVSHSIQQVMAHCTKKETSLVTIYDGIDLDVPRTTKNNNLRKELALTEDYLLVGMVAALTPEKDHETFIKVAYRFVKDNSINVKFLIIGEGKLKNELKQLIKSLNISEHIIFLGFRKDISEILHSLDIFMITSKREGLGTSIIDAMATGVPVIATRTGGIPELVEHEETGLLADVGDVEKLTAHVEKLTKDSEQRSRFSEAALIKAKNFDIKIMASGTLNVYQSVLAVCKRSNNLA